MDDIDKCIPVSRELFNRIQTLISGIEVDLDAPLPPEEISEEESWRHWLKAKSSWHCQSLQSTLDEWNGFVL